MASRKAFPPLLGLTAAAVIVILVATGVLRPVADLLVRGLTAAAGPAYGAGAAVHRAADRLFAPAQDDRDALRKTIDDLRAENAKLRELATENESLKAALDFSERKTDDAVLARVVSETGDDAFHGLVIDRGTDDGVMPGQPVVVGDGILVGKVFEARRRTASVLLLADSKSRIAVAVQNATDTAGVLEGDRGLSMAIDLIPQTETLAPGDVIVTSGIEPGVRRGLIVGTIDAVHTNTQDPFQSATIVPFSAAAHPPYVQVLRPARETNP